MKTRISNLDNSGLARFQFAGLTFPKYVWTLPVGNFKKRIDSHVNAVTGDYYHAPSPVDRSSGMSFYLDSDGMPSLRWKWCDDVDGASIDHTGWFTDEYCDTKIRGVVFRLAHGRGFLAGWSMGKSMASSLDYTLYSDEVDAAFAADSMAESAADDEREYQEKERERLDAEESEREGEESTYWANRDSATH